jgi:serine phosphatase RsbU (regulator of sigma subunit)
MPEEGKVVASVEEANVSKETIGPATLYRFSGASSPALAAWLAGALQDEKRSVALQLRDLSGADADLVREIVRFARDAVRRKRQAALIDPPGRVVELVLHEGASDLLPVLSCTEALRDASSIPDALLKERAALSDLASRYQANPLWRKADVEAAWLCPLCGAEVSEVRIRSPLKPAAAVFGGMRAHLLELCPAWRQGRRLPLPQSALDSFLAEINVRKSADAAKRRWESSREVESLQAGLKTMQDLERSVEEARRKQLHLLPVDPEPDAAADIGVVYRPLQSVSGDFLDFYSLEDDRFGVAIGDVSGHGVETAITMGMAKMALRVRSQGLGTLKDLMSLANRDLFSELRRSAFVTGVVGWIERPTRTLTYVRAGHPRPLLRRASGGCEELDGTGLPFGVDAGVRFAAGLEEREVTLEPGDLVLFYTDGVIEAGPPSGQFGMERLKEAFASAPADSAKAAAEAVSAALDAFLAGQTLGDDVTLVVLRIL